MFTSHGPVKPARTDPPIDPFASSERPNPFARARAKIPDTRWLKFNEWSKTSEDAGELSIFAFWMTTLRRATFNESELHFLLENVQSVSVMISAKPDLWWNTTYRHEISFFPRTSRTARIMTHTIFNHCVMPRDLFQTPSCSRGDFMTLLRHKDLVAEHKEHKDTWIRLSTGRDAPNIFPIVDIRQFEHELKRTVGRVDHADCDWDLKGKINVLRALTLEFQRRRNDVPPPIPENSVFALNPATFNEFARSAGSSTDICSICHETTDTGITTTNQAIVAFCGHSFHEECIEPWFTKRSSCPECRAQFETCNTRYNMNFLDRITMQTHRGVKRKEPT
jgi:hypothetical protein